MKDKKDIKFKGAIVGNTMDIKLDLESIFKEGVVDLDFNCYPIYGLDYTNDSWCGNHLSNNKEYLEHKKRFYKKTTIDDVLNKKDVLLDIIDRNLDDNIVEILIEIFDTLELLKENKDMFKISLLYNIKNYCYYIESINEIGVENIDSNDIKELDTIITVIDNFIKDNRDKIEMNKIKR